MKLQNQEYCFILIFSWFAWTVYHCSALKCIKFWSLNMGTDNSKNFPQLIPFQEDMVASTSHYFQFFLWHCVTIVPWSSFPSN